MNEDYADFDSAGRGLLVDSASIVNELGLKYVVIGGWSSYLRNSGRIPHPGTRDVDLLFESGGEPGRLAGVVTAFLAAGYLSSAKHPFQMLRVLRVQGQELVFNVDLLHPSPDSKVADLFVDHLVMEPASLRYSYQSIVVPMSSQLFLDEGAKPYQLEARRPGGAQATVSVPLMTELGTLITKHESMYGPKRRRDAFDVMLAIHQSQDVAALSDLVVTLSLGARLYRLWGLVDDGSLRANIAQHWAAASEEASWQPVRASLTSFLEKAAVQRAPGSAR